MRESRLLWLVMLLLPTPVQAAESLARDDAAVLRSALAIVDGERWRWCVAPTLGRAPFSNMRARQIPQLAPKDRPPLTAAERGTIFRTLFTEWLAWTGDGHADPSIGARLADAAGLVVERGLIDEPLAQADTKQGNATGSSDDPMSASDEMDAMADAMEVDDEDEVRRPVDRSWLTNGQRMWGERGKPCAQITLSEVSHSGNIAFVEVGRQIDPLAGHSEIWALQRVGSRWLPVAKMRTWVS